MILSSKTSVNKRFMYKILENKDIGFNLIIH